MATQKPALPYTPAGPTAPAKQASPPRKISRFIRRHIWAIYLFPAVTVLFAVTMVPLFYLIYNSFTDWDLRRAFLGRSYIGTDNYQSMIHIAEFQKAVGTTILMAVGVVVVELCLGMLLALLFSRSFPGRRIARSLFLLPLITTPVVVGLTWRMLYTSDLGMINYVLGLVGLPEPVWLANPRLAPLSIIITDAWTATPFVTLMFVAGLQSIPTDPLEAAKVDGATAVRRFFDIVLPLMRPLVFLALMFRLTDAIRMFDLIYVMTGGGPANATQTLNMYAFKVGFSFLDIGYGSAVAVVLMLFSIAVSFVLVKFSGIELEGAGR